MKVKVEFVVARLDSKIIFIEPIQDCYTNVQVILSKEDLDELSIKELSGTLHISESNTGFNFGDYEAKEIPGIYGNVSIKIESKEIDFE